MFNQKAFSPLIIIIVLALLLGVGGYFVAKTKVIDDPMEYDQTRSNSPTPTLTVSDEVSDLENDLSTTNVDSVDAELGDLEKELENLE